MDDVLVAYRTFDSVAITGLVDQELVDVLPKSLKFITHNGMFICTRPLLCFAPEREYSIVDKHIFEEVFIASSDREIHLGQDVDLGLDNPV